MAECALNIGGVDTHSCYRRGQTVLHNGWKTFTWQHWVLQELFAATTVDAPLLSEMLMSKWKGDHDKQEKTPKFLRWLGAMAASSAF